MARKKKTVFAFSEAEAFDALFETRIADPHSILGIHKTDNGVIIRIYDPLAKEINILCGRGMKNRISAHKTDSRGLFIAEFPGKRFFKYMLEKIYPDDFVSRFADPYSFLPAVGETDIYLFNQGTHRKVYEMMGARLMEINGHKGVRFVVWAPNATRVSAVGNFNCWDGRRNMMRRLGESGLWELFIPGVSAGDLYKFEIRAANGDVFMKLDPYASATELRPNTAGIVADTEHFKWSDSGWMAKRASKNPLSQPMSIYEMHIGSWENPVLPPLENGAEFHNWREIAPGLAKYIKELGYTHIELLPVCEHPFDGSWGYQVTGFYAPTARHGSPEDFAYFVNYMHTHEIGIILDWVPAHFPKDAFALGRFDGTALYEHNDPRQGEHKDWGTYIFNYGRSEVRTFLLGSAFCWLGKYHIDGLRVDAVASMLYLDYSRKAGEWIPNEYGGRENLQAVSFLKELNEQTHKMFPGICMIAEESTAWPGVSHPVYTGGLGFTFKWNMGWMHDTLMYYSHEPVHRKYHHGNLTFSLIYAFSENFILPLSHDEVVHGKCSLLNKMPGDYQQKFANLRALYAYMFTHPGKKMLFMGAEFAQWTEWSEKHPLDWNLLDYPQHSAIKQLISDLNSLYRSESSLWENDFAQEGFEWLDGGNAEQSIVSYVRWNKDHTDCIAVIINLTPVNREGYAAGVPVPGSWKEILNTDAKKYGGTGMLNESIINSQNSKTLWHGQKQTITLNLPWLSAVLLKRID